MGESSESVRFGEFLRRAREQRGLTIHQISSETKIPWRHLDALEHGRLFEVPGGAYRRGEIVAYAAVVGLDRGLALAQLDRALETFEPQPPPVPQTPAKRRQSLGLASLLLASLAGAAIVAALMWRAPASGESGPATTGEGSPPRPVPKAAEVSPATPASGQGRLAMPRDPAIDTSVNAAAKSAPTEIDENPTAIYGQLVITSEPAGARVTLDGIGWGTTPLTIRHLPPGAKEIRVTKDGYSAEVRVVRLTPDTTTTVTIPLRATP